MTRKLAALLIVLVVASCGSRDTVPPMKMDDACAILQERPNYRRAFARAERRWGVPMAVQMAVMHQESKFVGNARTPHKYVLGIIPMGRTSSAYGYSQALDGTWDEYKASTGRRFAKRNDIGDATDFIGWYMAQSTLQLGIRLDDARAQYLAYHEGRGGYRRGSYRNKSWLLGVAQRVDVRAAIYATQLQYCR